eukprot:1622801-Amphidinium_carterae.2
MPHCENISGCVAAVEWRDSPRVALTETSSKHALCRGASPQSPSSKFHTLRLVAMRQLGNIKLPTLAGCVGVLTGCRAKVFGFQEI